MIDFTFAFSGVDPSESRLRSAEEHASQAAAFAPDGFHTHLLAASIAWARARPQEAVVEYRKALLQEPNHPDALLMLGQVYAVAGKTFAASAMLGRLLEVDPLTPANHSLGGLLTSLEGRFMEAADGCYRRLFELDPCPPAYHLYAMALARAGASAQARDLLDALARNAAGTALGDLAVFLCHALDGNAECAATAFNARLDSYCRYVFVLAWDVGAAFARLGNNDRALLWLRQAAALGFVHYPFLWLDPLLVNLRDDPRWSELAEEIRRRWQEFEV
jgi:tetratricopeptide (TPR) repeat protein